MYMFPPRERKKNRGKEEEERENTIVNGVDRLAREFQLRFRLVFAPGVAVRGSRSC